MFIKLFKLKKKKKEEKKFFPSGGFFIVKKMEYGPFFSLFWRFDGMKLCILRSVEFWWNFLKINEPATVLFGKTEFRWLLSFDWLINRVIDRLIDWFVHCLVDWLIDWFVYCSVDRLIDWLVVFVWISLMHSCWVFLFSTMWKRVLYHNSIFSVASVPWHMHWSLAFDGKIFSSFYCYRAFLPFSSSSCRLLPPRFLPVCHKQF